MDKTDIKKVKTRKKAGLFAKLSIRRKMVLMIMLVSCIAIILASCAFIASEWFIIRQRIVDDLSTLTEMIGENCIGALLFEDKQDATEVLYSLKARKPIEFAYLYNNDGSILASYQRDNFLGIDLPVARQGDGYLLRSTEIVIWKSITIDNKRLGNILIQSDLSELFAIIILNIKIAFIMILLTGIIAYILAVKLQRTISTPVISLAQTAKNISESQNYSIRATKNSEDEIGFLTDAFNNMLSQVEKSNAAMRESENRFRTLVENAADAFFLHDTNGVIIDVNQRACESLGYTRKELLSMKVTDIEFAIDLKRLKQIWGKLNSSKSVKVDGVHKRKDGTTFPVEANLGQLKRNSQILILSLTRDITDRKIAEERLKQSRNQFQSLVSNIPGITYRCALNNERTMIYISEDISSISGFPVSDFINNSARTFESIILREDTGYVNQSINEAVKSGRPWEIEYRIRRIDNNICWMYEKGKGIIDDNGKVKYLDGFILDITKRKQAEEALQRYECIVSSSNDMMALLNKNYIYLAANEAYLKPLGLTRNQVVGHTIAEVFGKTIFNETIKPRAEKCMKGNSVCYYEWFDYPVKGKCYMEVNYYPFLGLNNDIKGFTVNARDITQQRQAEEDLYKSEERFKSLVANIPGVIFRCENDENRTMNFISDTIEDLTGYPASDFIENKVRSFTSIIHPDDVDKSIENIRDSIKQGKSFVIDYRITDNEGNIHWITERGQGILGINGEIQFLDGALFDITEQKLSEKKRQKLEVQLRRSQKLETIGTLAGGIAHDFNNILSPIIGYADLMQSKLSSDDKIQSYLNQIIDAANRAKELVRQILTFSRQDEQERKPIFLHPIIKEALKLLRASIPTTIEIREEIDTECEPVLADSTQIHQVVMNLCANSFHAMRKRGGILLVKLEMVEVDDFYRKAHPELKDDSYVKLIISDTGHGIDSATLERIFEPFFTTKEVGEGTGMGLSVVHGIIESYGGIIKVYSELGKGTTFQIYLQPLHTKIEKDIEVKESIPMGKEHVLFVDDEEFNTNLGKEILEQLGYKVTSKTDSLQALDEFRRAPDAFDIVVTDLTMPSLTGTELAQQLKNIRADIPIILTTGFSSTITLKDREKLGISDFIMKPIASRELGVSIRKILDKPKRITLKI